MDNTEENFSFDRLSFLPTDIGDVSPPKPKPNVID